MVDCPACGHANAAGSNFCAQCGTKLTSTSDTTRTIPIITEDTRPAGEQSTEVLAAIRDLPASNALLLVERGPDTGARYLLDTDEATAGRHPKSDIFLDDITVSRHHCRFVRSQEGFSLEDLGSLNGTYVNRVLVDQPAPLNQGDEVQIGKYRMVFCVSESGMA
ncbi:FHA domain-containing protein [Propionibacteriaceae bacterium Y1923]|uniref:FHA domain-containing protein n=1 Tax=Aestuariimicrobium sp. Y1814 TaxID=3418742 RepID=UPI003C1B1C9A